MDRISGLSDEMLLKILLLVPTKVAVSTSILSKRWEYLWMWLPKLGYGHTYCSEPESKRLQCFLDHNLPLHRAPPSLLDLFMLLIWGASPSNLFTCKSLVILKLAGGMLLDVPRMVSRPSLKTLKLLRVKYFKDKTLQRLLSNCPVLEDLLDLRKNESSGKLTVVVPSLQSLSPDIPNSHEINGYVKGTPAVKYFKLVDDNDKSHYCLIEHMPNLIETHLDVSLLDIKSLVGSITSVKRLAICSMAMFDEGFVLNQLEHLKLCICRDHSSNQLFRLIKSSTILQELNLFSMDDHVTQFMDDWNEPSTVPECMMSTLQNFSWPFSLYSGEPQDRDIVIYILEHVVHLKTAQSRHMYVKFQNLRCYKSWHFLLELQQHANSCLNEYLIF
uniref:Uncharacterized protein n=2 Tax=Brassica oleracea TaxID=3712 RepID=A0A0D3DTC8_BRAOL|nr:unnamed protein product [Brassica oleracea]